ncbi:MAG: UDP-N-acetylmuramoyl-tripeptide--D-alanyl-D-alanine ligase [Candidatus Marinimicrobia bacterium]|nr:UDP-N-acetylmuramoyl-tripeptide--D-alanyl-D-alanine ligase [Candidatus Neomarinimicrobiota bacterium]
MRITLPEPKRFSKVFKTVTNTSFVKIVTGISTDSRQCIEGDLYIAIKGKNVDGHQFIQKAKDAGAVAALIVKSDEVINDMQQIVVEGTVKIIGEIANAWRKQFNVPIIGITGSNGKTTTKDLVKHILDSHYKVHATKGNYNTSIGVPLTLLQMQGNHNFSIIEMGANQPGDIKTLCQIIEPTDGLITNIAPAHLEGFGSIDKIAKEKSELFTHLTNGTAFINITDDWISTFTTNTKSKTYGCTTGCDFSADYYRESDGNIILIINANEINTNSQNIVFTKNILAASAIANSFGIDWNTIQERVLSFTPTYGRSVISKYDKITVIDDTYNANYNSTLAAIEHLALYPIKGRRIFIFGDMAELSNSSKKYHQKIGEKCVENNLDAVFTVGTQTVITDNVLDTLKFHKHYKTREQLSKKLINFMQNDDIILFKGSRSMGMEKIIQEVFKKK